MSFPALGGIFSHGGVNSHVGLSHGLWGDCDISKHGDDMNIFRFGGDDWSRQCGAALATNHALFGPWDGFGTTGVTFVADSSKRPRLKITTDADTEEAYLGFGAYGCPPIRFAEDGDAWFEASVDFSSVASTTGLAKMIGLAATGAPATGLIASGGAALGTRKFVGFRGLIADGDGLDAVFHSGSAETIVKEAADAPTLDAVADTSIKLGLRWRAKRQKLEYYVNGVKVAEQDTSVAAFPDADTDWYAPFIGVRQVGAGTFVTRVNWAWAAQKLSV